MSNTKLKLSIEQLTVLFNQLYLDSKTEFSITDDLYGLNLMNITISKEIRIRMNVELKDIKEAHDKIPNNIRGEFPDDSRFFEIFTKSGFYFETYSSVFTELLKEIDSVNILNGDVPIAVAFDTCLYYDQFFTQFSRLLEQKYKKPKYPIYFLLSEGVKKELMTYENKYKYNDIEDLKQNCHNPSIIEEFTNQNKFKARIKHLGHMDFIKCNEDVYSKIVEEDSSISRGDMDSRIIQGLVAEIRHQYLKLFLYSQDSDFIARARATRNVNTSLISKIPKWKFKKDYACSWVELNRFIYNLSITFGAVTLQFSNYESIQMLGIWRGKTLEDWEQENLKIITSHNIAENIKKDLAILNEIKMEEKLLL